MPSPEQWRNAANGLREHAAKWDELAATQAAEEIDLWAALFEWRDAEDRSLLDMEQAKKRLRDAVDRYRGGPKCTGVTAAWCPVHGDCTCPDKDLDDPGCSLHASTSMHGEGSADG